MKIISNEEKQAHVQHILAEGAKGLVYGGVVSAGLFAFFKHRYPNKFKTWNTSIKAALVTIPTIGIAAYWMDQGSWEFDKKMHHSGQDKEKTLDEYRKWNGLSIKDKVLSTLNSHKYEVVVAAWAASLYGSWRYVSKDKYMTTTQKAVQARVYAQAITVVLLLSTILLSMNEEKVKAKQGVQKQSWELYLDEEKARHDEIKRESTEKPKPISPTIPTPKNVDDESK